MDVLHGGNLQRVSFCLIARDHVLVLALADFLELGDRSALLRRTKGQFADDLRCSLFHERRRKEDVSSRKSSLADIYLSRGCKHGGRPSFPDGLVLVGQLTSGFGVACRFVGVGVRCRLTPYPSPRIGHRA